MNWQSLTAAFSELEAWLKGWLPVEMHPLVGPSLAALVIIIFVVSVAGVLLAFFLNVRKFLRERNKDRVRSDIDRKLAGISQAQRPEFRSELAEAALNATKHPDVRAIYHEYVVLIDAAPAGPAQQLLKIAAPEPTDPLVEQRRKAFTELVKSADKHEVRAMRSLLEGRPEDALSLLKDAAGLDPEQAAKRYRRIATLVQAHSPDIARKTLEAAVELEPNNPGCRHSLGDSFRLKHRATGDPSWLTRAVEQYAAVATNPQFSDAIRAEAYTKQGEALRLFHNADQEALKCHRTALKIRADASLRDKGSRDHHGIGRILRKTGEIEAALEHHTIAAKLDWASPDLQPRALVNQSLTGVLNRQLGRISEARRIHETILKRHAMLMTERLHASELNNLGIVLRLQGEYAASRRLLDQSRTISIRLRDGSESYALNALGDLALAQGRWADADKIFKDVLERFPKAVPYEIRDKLGVIERLRGNLDAAEVIHTRALQHAGAKSSRVMLNLAWVRALKGSPLALEILADAETGFKDRGERLDLIECLEVRAHADHKAGNTTLAIQTLQSAAHQYKDCGATGLERRTEETIAFWSRTRKPNRR